jgi:6-pyruvoyltetrahydropterin/6-carboxytetrahydropterin synthase
VSRWVIHAEASFDARHALTSYRGKHESVHGHSWRIAVQVGAGTLNEEGYALDFHEVRAILAAAVAPLDRTDLNEHPEIGIPSPTAERVAEVLTEKLTSEFEGIGGSLLSVSVWEGPDNRVDLILE